VPGRGLPDDDHDLVPVHIVDRRAVDDRR